MKINLSGSITITGLKVHSEHHHRWEQQNRDLDRDSTTIESLDISNIRFELDATPEEISAMCTNHSVIEHVVNEIVENASEPLPIPARKRHLSAPAARSLRSPTRSVSASLLRMSPLSTRLLKSSSSLARSAILTRSRISTRTTCATSTLTISKQHICPTGISRGAYLDIDYFLLIMINSISPTTNYNQRIYCITIWVFRNT